MSISKIDNYTNVSLIDVAAKIDELIIILKNYGLIST